MWTPADWAWIGGLINAVLGAWYHGVPIVGGLANKFEPHAAMAMIADHGIRNVFLANGAEATGKVLRRELRALG